MSQKSDSVIIAQGGNADALPSRGVTVVICCHNAAGRLVPTLQHLAAQVTDEGTLWEVLVIDNASSDATASVARSAWPCDHRAPLRIIREDRLGLSYARTRGLAEARYEYISFVDDDNWVSPKWIEMVCDIFDGDRQVGACGGVIEPVFETTPPEWFERYKKSFAVGDWGPVARYTAFTDIWGAGLSIRKTAWDQLCNAGFSWSLSDRQGEHLSSCGDTELCGAISLLGWKLWYDPRLQLKHFMPAQRLTWRYLRRLWRSFGYARPTINLYSYELRERPATWYGSFRQTWTGSLLYSVYWLARKGGVLLTTKEGNDDQIFAETMRAMAATLLKGLGNYHQCVRKVRKLCAALDAEPAAVILRVQHIMEQRRDEMHARAMRTHDKTEQNRSRAGKRQLAPSAASGSRSTTEKSHAPA